MKQQHQQKQNHKQQRNLFQTLGFGLVCAVLAFLVQACGTTESTEQQITTAYGISTENIPQKEDIDSIRVHVLVSGDSSFSELYLSEDIDSDLLAFNVDAPEESSVKVEYRVYAEGSAVAAGSFTFSSGDSPTIPDPSLPPEIDAGADTTAIRASDVVFSGTVLKRESEITSYAWDFDGDGSIDDESSINSGFSYSYSDSGTYTAYFVATGALGLQSKDSMLIQVQNPAPTIDNLSAPTRVAIGDSAELNIIATSAYGQIIMYDWDLDGDGQWDTSGVDLNVLEHAFREVRDFTVMVQVTDSDSNFTLDTAEIEVYSTGNNLPPEIDRMHQSGVIFSIQDTVSFSLEYSEGYTSNSGDASTRAEVVSFQWDFDGDGTWDLDTNTADTVFHIYNSPGSFPVRVLITDENGNVDSANASVQVIQGVPTLTLTAPQGGEIGTGINFTAEASDDNWNAPVGSIISYEWDFDGDEDFERTSETDSIDYTFPDDYESHEYQVVARITDDDGNTVLDTVQITIENSPPALSNITLNGEKTVSIKKPAIVKVNSVDVTDINSNQIDSIYWVFSDDAPDRASAIGDTIHVVRDTEKTVKVKAIVKDSWGARDSAEIIVVFREGTPTVTGTEDIWAVMGEGVELSPEISFELEQTLATCEWEISQANANKLMGSCDTTIILPSYPYGADDPYQAVFTATSDVGTTVQDTINIIVREGFKDSRDGEYYAMTTIGNQTWMAENLNYSGHASLGNKTYETGWCYGVSAADTSNHSDSSTCDAYGRLYTWDMAMNTALSSELNPSDVQGLCPDGWHIPSDAEWTELTNYIIEAEASVTSLEELAPYLKASYSWNTGSAEDSYGFTALAGGNRTVDGNFSNLGNYTGWWTATEETQNSNNAWYRYLVGSSDAVGTYNTDKNYGYSIRCVQNE